MWWRRKQETDLKRELDAHLELETGEQNGDVHAAQRKLGNRTRILEDTRATWRWMWIDRLAGDMNHALRALLRRPTFTAVAILSLALAVGANTAVFSFANTILIRTLPVPDSKRLVLLKQNNKAFNIDNCCFRHRDYEGFRVQATDFEGMLALSPGIVVLIENGRTERLDAEFVSGNYYRVLGVRAAAGRVLDEGDDGAEGTGAVAVISHRLWLERFGGSADVVGRRVTINEEPFQIVGVTQAGFTGASLHNPRDIQIPASMMGKLQGVFRDRDGWAQVVGRLKPGVRQEDAQARLDVIGKLAQRANGLRITEEDDFRLYDGSQGVGSQKEALGDAVVVLMLLVGVVLLVACGNLAALMLMRSIERVRDAGMRVALGASPAALFRVCLIESALLGALGGVAGWGVASLLVKILSTMMAIQYPALVVQTRLDWATFAFAALTTMVAAFIFGILPAVRMAKADPLVSIQKPASSRRRHPRLSRMLIAGQVAMSLMLLFSAGLFARTLANLRAIEVGFPPENLIMLEPDLAKLNGTAKRQFFADLQRQARELPGVSAVSIANIAVLSGTLIRMSVTIPDRVPAGGTFPTAYMLQISPDYFKTLGVPVTAGREFATGDGPGDVTPVIVNEEFARLFMNGDALRKSFAYGSNRRVTVVGVVGNAKFLNLREDTQPTLYLPNSQFPNVLQVRTSGEPGPIIERLRALTHAIDPQIRLERLSTMRSRIDDLLTRERLLSFLSAWLGSVAAALSAIGLYGVVAFSVARRKREVGIRVAVGAGRPEIVALLLREGVWPVALGIAGGAALILFCGRFVTMFLYGLQPLDANTAAASVAVQILVAAAATLVPAWRATRIDAVEVLRRD